MNYDDQLHALEQQFRPYESKWMLLTSALSVAVPLYMADFQQQGGITDRDVDRVQSYLKDLTEHGDDLYFRSTKEEKTAERFDQVAEIIAVLSFTLGGITIFGLHFEAHSRPFQLPGISDDEGQKGEEKSS